MTYIDHLYLRYEPGSLRFPVVTHDSAAGFVILEHVHYVGAYTQWYEIRFISS